MSSFDVCWNRTWLTWYRRSESAPLRLEAILCERMALPAALCLRQRASSEGRGPRYSNHTQHRGGPAKAKVWHDRKQGVGVLKEPGHIVGIKRSVLETTCPLAVALLPMAVLIILAMIF